MLKLFDDLSLSNYELSQKPGRVFQTIKLSNSILCPTLYISLLVSYLVNRIPQYPTILLFILKIFPDRKQYYQIL